MIKEKRKNCMYYEWDETTFELPGEYKLTVNSELADALSVFYIAGGYDFFNVINPKYYASNWLEFMGKLYSEIMEDKYVVRRKTYIIPLDDAQRGKLASQNVPQKFICNIE